MRAGILCMGFDRCVWGILSGFGPDYAAMPDHACKRETMRDAPEGNDRAVYEGRRLRKTVELTFEPVHMAGEKVVRVFDAAAFGKSENG